MQTPTRSTSLLAVDTLPLPVAYQDGDALGRVAPGPEPRAWQQLPNAAAQDLTPLSRARGPGGRWRFLWGALTVGAAASSALAQTTQPPALQRAAIERAVVDVLKARPELVRDALAQLERRDADNRAAAERKALAESGPALQSAAGSTVLGNPAGDVTLVEFIDYRCGYCKSLSASIDTLLQRDKQVRVLVKHLPILGPESVTAAQLMLTSGKGSEAARLHHALINAPALDPAAVKAIAASAPAPGASATAAANQDLAAVAALAERLGIQGTPAIVIGDQLFRGALDVQQLEAAIQAARQQRKAKALAG